MPETSTEFENPDPGTRRRRRGERKFDIVCKAQSEAQPELQADAHKHTVERREGPVSTRPRRSNIFKCALTAVSRPTTRNAHRHTPTTSPTTAPSDHPTPACIGENPRPLPAPADHGLKFAFLYIPFDHCPPKGDSYTDESMGEGGEHPQTLISVTGPTHRCPRTSNMPRHPYTIHAPTPHTTANLTGRALLAYGPVDDGHADADNPCPRRPPNSRTPNQDPEDDGGGCKFDLDHTREEVRVYIDAYRRTVEIKKREDIVSTRVIS
ncbi:hypothetical protein EIP86_011079 [Pleurotus ostreatoroseus]|nr:hypothetical protein EIP86_011079 [Pleurotus ostreatoroseus]